MLSVVIPSHKEENIQEFIKQIESEIRPAQIIVCNDRYGKGKGWALREAMQEVRGQRVIFIDGDGDIKPYEIKKILSYLNQYDVVVGKKELPIRKDRKIITFLSRLYIKFMFGINIDTQTGLKGFNYKPEWKTDGWIFDVEILYNAKKLGKSIIEIPVKATVSSGKSFKDIWSTFIDSLKVRWRR